MFQKAFAAHHAGRLDEAKDLYKRVLQKTPADAEVLYLLGTAYSQLADYDEAKKYLDKALAIRPAYPEALSNMGLTLKKGGRASEAVDYYKRALELNPSFADAHGNLASALEALGRIDEAEEHARQALRLNPDSFDAFYVLGLVLKAKDCFDEASQCFLAALRLRPGDADVYCDLGTLYKSWGRTQDALTWLEQAVALNPAFHKALNNLGAVLEEMGRFDEAGKAYDRALEVEPESLMTRWNKAHFYLAQGMLKKGWEAYELRFNPALAITLNRFPFPQWDGADLADKTILIYAEQGLGDEILFASCITDVIARAKHCVIECEKRLAPIFVRSFPSATVIGASRDDISWLLNVPSIDVQCAIGSLPRILRPAIECFPEAPAYLLPDPDRLAYWRSRVEQLGHGLKIGICWRSGLTKGERRKLYSQLTQWGPVFSVPGVHFINLQYGECGEELREAEQTFGIKITDFPEVDLRNAIDESAALTKALDLVISAGTAVAEISGALGVEVWRLDAVAAPWTALGTKGMPWHPLLKRFPRPPQGDWDVPLAQIGRELAEKVRGESLAAEFVRTTGGVELAIDGSLHDMLTYVLKEQGKWFEPEYAFFIEIVEPDMHVVDVGAGNGIYSIPMAAKLSSGRALALTRTPADEALLLASRDHEKLESHLDVSIAEPGLILDAEMTRKGLGDIAMVRVVHEMCNAAFLSGAEQTLTTSSPIVMFGIKTGTTFDSAVTAKLVSLGYRIYRFVPGLRILVPFEAIQELDAFSLNLFACKSDRAGLLERRGLLAGNIAPLERLPSADEKFWQQYLGRMPYSQALMPGWTQGSQKPVGWEVYWMALNFFAMARDESRSGSERYASLVAATNVTMKLVSEQATLPRMLSLVRMLSDLGRREAAVNLLNQVCGFLSSGLPLVLDEPCLPLNEDFSQRDPGLKLAEWIVAMVLTHREGMRAFSTYFTGQEALPALQEIRALGFSNAEIERRIELINARFSAL